MHICEDLIALVIACLFSQYKCTLLPGFQYKWKEIIKKFPYFSDKTYIVGFQKNNLNINNHTKISAHSDLCMLYCISVTYVLDKFKF